MPVIGGIPQGSVLDPLLFVIYINDLPEYMGDNVECDLFADDAKLSKHVRGTADAAGILQLGFNRLFDWTSNLAIIA